MEVRRTVPVKLDVTDSDVDLLHETIHQFRWAANYVVRTLEPRTDISKRAKASSTAAPTTTFAVRRTFTRTSFKQRGAAR